MAKINVENHNGINVAYVNIQDGARVYLLPNVPVDAGKSESEGQIDLEEIISKIPKDAPKSVVDKTRDILGKYRGRLIDAASVLMYALEQGKFDKFAKRLDEMHEDFKNIHPDMMLARTDVTAFFLQIWG
ncbi:MAG: hypothetical protein QXD13_01765 [Candidatus Pacearchaeota archaeon]